MENINLNINLKKNNLDEIFLNLSSSPVGLEKKNLKVVLSNIYELIEEEYANTFESVHPALRHTQMYLIKQKNKFEIFVTPGINFTFYLKSKGSMFRQRTELLNIEGLGECEGYKVGLDIIWDYFCGFDEYLNLDYTTETFKLINILTQVGNKIIEKLHFIPVISSDFINYKIQYEVFSLNNEVLALLKNLENLDWEKALITRKDVLTLLNHYINFQVYRFLNVRVSKIENKELPYFTKTWPKKSNMKTDKLAQNFQNWLDEICIGKYPIVPQFEVISLSENSFRIYLSLYFRKYDKKIKLENIEGLSEIYGYSIEYIEHIVQKQIDYIQKYLPSINQWLCDLNQCILSLNDVYNLITQTNYELQRMGIRLILPKEFDNIIIPRASINASIKNKREDEVYEMLTSAQTGIKLDEIFNFKYEVTIGNERISLEEFKNLTQNVSGLIKYKDMYVLIDEKHKNEIIKKYDNVDLKEQTISSLELLSSTYTGQIKDLEFDYDQAFMKIVNNINKIEDIQVPENLLGTLRKYQETGFKWLYTNTVKGFGSCIADDMGLGKTVQVIALMLKLINDRKIKGQILVVCPTTLVGNWVKEINTFANILKTVIYHGNERKFDDSANIIITTYAILRIDLEKFKKKKWDLLIVDEAQNIKNPDTSQAQALKSLKSTYKIAMTGTPVENKLTELWSIFDFINKGYLGSLKDFQKSYVIPIEKFKEVKRAEKLKLCISPFILRRLKTDKNIISDLPNKLVVDEYCYLSKVQKILYEKVLNEIMTQVSQSSGINRRGLIFKLITALKQICNHPFHYLKSGSIAKENSGKSEKFLDLIGNILDNKEKTLVFTQYKEMGKILQEMLRQEFDANSLFFHGSLSRNEREAMIEKFQSNEQNKIMILSLKAGGTGLNLTAATNVIHYDLWWNPAVEDQATDRTYRIGQDKNVMVHRLITLGTFEEKIDEIIKNKQKLANMAVFEGEKMITELSDKEIFEIFNLSA